ncbi:MAG TPA: hypothetical protein ENN28_01920 [Candidatus Uhrbacteria bacterium]|mgnify:CR=1 FL=1|nr:hypothetical protein [Candidatus Uhrbacteria bacterium]
MEKEAKKKIKRVKKQFKIKASVLSVVIIIIAVFFAFNIVFAWGIYKLDWQGDITKAIVGIIPYPAAKINNDYISFNDYLKNLKAYQHFYEKQKQAGFLDVPESGQLKKMALEERLMTDYFVRKIASDYDVIVPALEIDQEINKIIAQKGGSKELERFLDEFYGLNIEEYRKYFTEPGLYIKKTSAKLSRSNLILDNLLKEAREDAQIKIYVY